MAKKNTQIQKQLEEGLKNAGQVVDQQIEGKAAPKPASTTPPAVAAPSAPAAGGTPVAPQPTQGMPPSAPSPRLQLESEIAKVIKDSKYFVDEFRKIRDGVMRNESAVGLQDRLQKLSLAISGASEGKLPAEQVAAFLTEKVQAQANPAVIQEAMAKAEAQPTSFGATDPSEFGPDNQAGATNEAMFGRAQSPEMAQGGAETPPAMQSEPSVAPTAQPVDPMAPVEAPETQVTATTPVQPGLSPEEMAMLETADADMAGQREQIRPQGAGRVNREYTPAELAEMEAAGTTPEDVAAMGGKSEIREIIPASIPDDMLTPEERLLRQEQRQASMDKARKIKSGEVKDPYMRRRERILEQVDSRQEPEWVLKQRAGKVREARRQVMEFGSLNPVDDLYRLFDRMFGPTGLRDFAARNSMADSESYSRGSTAMRMSLPHFALGYLPDSIASNPQITELRNSFDAIMRELGVDQDIIDQARSPMATKGRKDFNKNAREQREAIDEIVRIVEKLKDGGALRRPDVAPSLHVLTQLISDIDSDIANDSYIKFNPRNEYGQKIETRVDNLELVTQGLVDRISDMTGEDLRVVVTESGEISRPGWSPLTSNGSTFTAQNAIRYETSSRRRYALDKAGVIDPRWQQVDAQGVDVPSFVNAMHPTPDTTKAAIGFILTTDPTSALHYASGGRGRRDTMRESAIIKQIKDYLSGTDYNDTAFTWQDALDGDIGVGDNIEYTLDSSVVDSEVARRRSLLPTDRLVIVSLDPELFPIGTVFQDGKGNSHPVLNDYGIMVLPDGHPLIDQAVKNQAKITRPFSLGSVADISAIVPEGEFGQLLVDVDPHVFPAVKHTLPLRDPMGRKGTVALVPQIFIDESPVDIRIQLRDENGIPSPRRIVPQTGLDGEPLAIAAPERAKSFSGRGPEGKKKQVVGVEDVQAATKADGSWEGKAVVLVRDIDVSAKSPDWPEGIPVGVVANDNGDFPNLGTLADRYLDDIDEFDTRRRWVVGDMLATQQGDDRPRGGMSEDPFYGRAHGGVTDAEMERGLAIMRDQDAMVEAGTPKRDMPALSPDDEELLGKVRGRMTTNRKYSPARSPYDADEIFGLSEDQWAVSQREKVDRKSAVAADGDPFVADVATGEGVSYQPLDTETATDVRRLKGRLMYLLAVRATKANFDRVNSKEGTRQVGDVVGFAPEIAAIRQELSRVGVTTAAIDTFISNVGDRMPGMTPEDKALLRSELMRPMITTLETVTPVSSLAGLGVSSRGQGAEGRQFITPEQAGVDPLNRLDKIAYTVASEMARSHQLSRTQGQAPLSIDAIIQEQASKEESSDEFAGFEDTPEVETTDELASLMTETPADTRARSARRVKPELRSKAFSGIRTAEDLRIVARKAFTIYSLFAARDDAGDGWVKFINNVLYTDGMAAAIGDKWQQSGEVAIAVDRKLFKSGPKDKTPLTTKDGSRVGLLTDNLVKLLVKNTDYGAGLVDFQKENGLDFVVIEEPARDKSGKIIPGKTVGQVYILKVEKDKTGKKIINLADVSDLSSKYGYQPLADDTSFSQTEERIKTILRENGSDTLFNVLPATDNSGRYILELRPEALIEFGLFDGDPSRSKAWVESAGEFGELSDKNIQRYKIMLDTMVKFKFYEDMRGLAVRLGLEDPFPGMTVDKTLQEVESLYKVANGISSNGETSGPFGMRRAIQLNNENIPGEGIIPRVISKEPLPEAQQTEDWVRYLSYGDRDVSPGADPMLDAALDSNSIRDDLARKIITKGRAGSPESATGRRVETETTRAMMRRAQSTLKSGKLSSILKGNAGQGVAGGAIGLAALAAAGQLSEDTAKTALAFEAIGAVSPALSAAASLGFTGMNKGDMLRTLVNIIGGFGGAAVGSIAGTAALPVAGSFAGGVAGSMAGSAIADNVYSQLVGTGGGQQYVPNNAATVSEPAVPEDKDPFSVYKKLGG